MTKPSEGSNELDEIFMDLRVSVYKVSDNEVIDRLITDVQDRVEAHVKAEIRKTLLRIKEEMKMHTVPEGKGLITRAYLNSTIDYEIKSLEER